MSVTRRNFVGGGLALAAAAGVAPANAAERMYRIGWFANWGPPSSRWHALWREELARHGYVEGRNLEVRPVPKWRGDFDKMNASVREMVDWKPDVIVTQFTFNTLVAQRATTSIPIVFFQVADPAAVGIVKSLARPEGNTTGVAIHNLTLSAKRLELIRELLPGARRVGIIVDPAHDGYPPDYYPSLRDVAKRLDLQLIEEDVVQSPGGFDEVFEKMARAKADFVLPIGSWPGMRIPEYDLVKLQDRHRIPVIALGRTAGTRSDSLLVHLGVDTEEMFDTSMEMVARILGGARPGDVPVRQLMRVKLTINLKTAHEFGIPVPKSILARADAVIE